ncbi:MAG: hypothetical protein HGB06_02885 [Chlorobaculum sp.]|jgi:hypothetical protein|nr:hypothetical protein [Chlorobaculum sp.]
MHIFYRVEILVIARSAATWQSKKSVNRATNGSPRPDLSGLAMTVECDNTGQTMPLRPVLVIPDFCLSFQQER